MTRPTTVITTTTVTYFSLSFGLHKQRWEQLRKTHKVRTNSFQPANTSRNTGYTQKNGADSIVNTIETAPLFCVYPVLFDRLQQPNILLLAHPTPNATQTSAFPEVILTRLKLTRLSCIKILHATLHSVSQTLHSHAKAAANTQTSPSSSQEASQPWKISSIKIDKVPDQLSR
jgi:hypothetical protein